MIQYI